MFRQPKQLPYAALCQGGLLDLDARPTQISLAPSPGDEHHPGTPPGEGIPGFIGCVPSQFVACPQKKGEHRFTTPFSPQIQ